MPTITEAAGLGAQLQPCAECGMPNQAGEYHPYAACLMFKACRDAGVVRANLDAVIAHGYQLASEARVPYAQSAASNERVEELRALAIGTTLGTLPG